MQVFGPLIPGMWQVPAALAEALAQVGRPVPQVVRGLFLIDTGASATCIAEEVAAELGLRAVGRRLTRGAHGTQTNNVYEARLSVTVPNNHGGPASVHADLQVSGIPELASGNLGLRTPDGSPDRLIGLLGRDFLRYVTLTYNGAAGRITLQIDPSIPVVTGNPAGGSAS